jgi:hypothetical protein
MLEWKNLSCQLHGQKVMPMPITMDPSYYQQLESQLEDYKK